MILDKIWNGIVNWFKSLDMKTIIISIIEALIFIFIISSISHCSNQKIQTLDHNLVAAQDEIQTLVLENGNLLSEKAAYILKNKELESVLEIKKKNKQNMKRRGKYEKKPPEPLPEIMGEPVDDGYDGYYNDVLPPDMDRTKDGLDKELIKKIAALITVVIFVIGMCVALLYIL